jgi:hypothetical protein
MAKILIGDDEKDIVEFFSESCAGEISRSWPLRLEKIACNRLKESASV